MSGGGSSASGAARQPPSCAHAGDDSGAGGCVARRRSSGCVVGKARCLASGRRSIKAGSSFLSGSTASRTRPRCPGCPPAMSPLPPPRRRLLARQRAQTGGGRPHPYPRRRRTFNTARGWAWRLSVAGWALGRPALLLNRRHPLAVNMAPSRAQVRSVPRSRNEAGTRCLPSPMHGTCLTGPSRPCHLPPLLSGAHGLRYRSQAEDPSRAAPSGHLSRPWVPSVCTPV